MLQTYSAAVVVVRPRAPAGPPVRVADHTRWARGIARGVRADFGFLSGSSEEQELEATAALVLVEYAARFDPGRVPPGGDAGGLFRGWCAVEVRSRCRREAVRLRNGGTFHTSNDPDARSMVVRGVPDRCENCSQVVFGVAAPPDRVAAVDDADEAERAAADWLAARGYN